MCDWFDFFDIEDWMLYGPLAEEEVELNRKRKKREEDEDEDENFESI